jgi:hypothetical protein
MKNFRIKADATFKAENIEDALVKLSDYFKTMAVSDNLPEKSIIESGEVDVKPSKNFGG